MYGHLAPRLLLDCQISCQESYTSVVPSCRLLRNFKPLAWVRLCRVSICSLTTILTATMYSSRLKWDEAFIPGPTPTWFPVHAQGFPCCMYACSVYWVCSLGTSPIAYAQLFQSKEQVHKKPHFTSIYRIRMSTQSDWSSVFWRHSLPNHTWNESHPGKTGHLDFRARFLA